MRAWLAAVALLGGATSCSRPSPPNVVIVVLDTARPDYLSVYGHPRPTSPYLERFAAQGVLYERAYSTSSWTVPAHASLFSGMLPSDHGATQARPRLTDRVPALADRLRQAGYATAGFSANPWVSSDFGFGRGFDHFGDAWKFRQSGPMSIADHPVLRGVTEWLDGRTDRQRPFFVFANLIEPHMSYTPSWSAAKSFFADPSAWQAASTRLFPGGDAGVTPNRHYGGQAPLGAQEWAALRALYEAELLTTDQIARRIVEVVDARADSTRTIVFLVSDHGENLGDHGHLGHMFNLYDSNLRIALLARGPGFAAGTVERALVQITDVYPTVLHAAGLAPEPGTAGADLRAARPERRVLAAALDFPRVSLLSFPDELRRDGGALDRYKRSLWAAVGPRYKAIRGSDGTFELFDLVADPEELAPLRPDALDAGALRELEQVLAGARPQDGEGTGEPAEDLQRIEALRSLGYVH